MLVGFSFEAKPGKAEELEAPLSDPERARTMTEALGATRNIMVWQGDRMVRVLGFPAGTTPIPMAEVAERDPSPGLPRSGRGAGQARFRSGRRGLVGGVQRGRLDEAVLRCRGVRVKLEDDPKSPCLPPPGS